MAKPMRKLPGPKAALHSAAPWTSQASAVTPEMTAPRRDGSRAQAAYRKAAAKKRVFCIPAVYTIGKWRWQPSPAAAVVLTCRQSTAAIRNSSL